jgi:hypothetical protein
MRGVPTLARWACLNTVCPGRLATLKNAVFWDVTSCDSCKNRRFGRTYRFHNQGENVNVITGSPILVTLIIEVTRYSETSVLIRATRRNISEDGIIHSHRREDIKSYIALTGWVLQRRRNVFPVRFELGFYIPEGSIFHSHRRDYLKSYTAENFSHLARLLLMGRN